jgi:VWFA-related protein
MVLITDGDDQGSKVTRQAAIEAAQKADAVIYSIFYANYGYGSDEGALKRLSEETGGKVFSVRGRTTLEDIFREIQEEMRSQYSISYAPINGVKDGTYRKIDFKMSNKDYKVQARKGYYAIDTDRDR